MLPVVRQESDTSVTSMVTSSFPAAHNLREGRLASASADGKPSRIEGGDNSTQPLLTLLLTLISRLALISYVLTSAHRLGVQHTQGNAPQERHHGQHDGQHMPLPSPPTLGRRLFCGPVDLLHIGVRQLHGSHQFIYIIIQKKIGACPLEICS